MLNKSVEGNFGGVVAFVLDWDIVANELEPK